jgi:hypothetical protein
LLLGRHRTCKGVTKALLGHRIKALLLLGHLVKATETAEATLLLLGHHCALRHRIGNAKATTEALLLGHLVKTAETTKATLLTTKAATKARLTTKAAEAALLEHTAHR